VRLRSSRNSLSHDGREGHQGREFIFDAYVVSFLSFVCGQICANWENSL
jgi:hypothetical protein